MLSISSTHPFLQTLKLRCHACKLMVLKVSQIAIVTFKLIRNAFLFSFKSVCHRITQHFIPYWNYNSSQNPLTKTSNFNLKAKIQLYTELPSREISIRNIPVAKEFGSHIITLANVILKPEDVEEILILSSEGVILFSLISLRTLLFNPSDLDFYNFHPLIFSINRYQAPSFFSYEDIDRAKEIFELKKQFNNLPDNEKEIIIDHLDSEIHRNNSNQYFLISKIKTSLVEMGQQSAILSKKGKDVYQEIHAMAHRLHRHNLSFCATLEHSLNL